MNAILIVARREFRQIASLRSFWLTLLLLPMALALGPVIGEYLNKDQTKKVVLVDQSGGAAAATIKQSFAIEQDRANLAALARYARRYHLEGAASGAPWAHSDRVFSDADVALFQAQGGLPEALKAIERAKPKEVRKFEAPEADYSFRDPSPALLSARDETARKREVDRLLDRKNQDKASAIDMVVVIGPDYPRNPEVRLYANDEPRRSFVMTLQGVLTGDLRQRMLAAEGLSPQRAAAVQSAMPQIAVTTPPPGGGLREAVLVRSILPLAISYALLMCLMLSGSWMLQSAVEERSNKLIEALLACVKPEELMYGKLLGTLAIGLSMILCWTACGAVAAFASKGMFAELIRPALASVSSPGTVLAMLYFFLAGYIAISILFMAIGTMAESMNDAQGFLMPLIFALMLPIMALLQSILSDKGGMLAQVLTWLPLWTPFAVLARLGSGITAWELIGSGAVLALFVALELVLLGRLFRHTLLAQGQKPTLRRMAEALRRGGD